MVNNVNTFTPPDPRLRPAVRRTGCANRKYCLRPYGKITPLQRPSHKVQMSALPPVKNPRLFTVPSPSGTS